MNLEQVLKLIDEGKFAEAKAVFQREVDRASYLPTRMEEGPDGRPRFFRGRRLVACDADGIWKPAMTQVIPKKRPGSKSQR
jgi:hypothetical protein